MTRPITREEDEGAIILAWQLLAKYNVVTPERAHGLIDTIIRDHVELKAECFKHWGEVEGDAHWEAKILGIAQVIFALFGKDVEDDVARLAAITRAGSKMLSKDAH